jgi:hypothetical protein
MAFDFPSSPTNGQEYTSGLVTYVYNGVGWGVKGGGNYVSKTGDTMTGVLTMQDVAIYLNKTVSTNFNLIYGMMNYTQRWRVDVGDGAAESGGNVGSDFDIHRFADNGDYLGAALTINRKTGIVNFQVAPTVAGAPISAGGSYVAKTGDTMTGDLIITKDTPQFWLNRTGTGASIIRGKKNNLERWAITLGDGDPESGGNAGSSFRIYNFNDAGANIGIPFQIDRADGSLHVAYTFFSSGINIAAAIYAPSKGHHLGVAGGSVGVLADANIKLYDNGSGNWSGMGTDSSGQFWIRTGLADSAAKNLVISNTGKVTLNNGLVFASDTGATVSDLSKHIDLGWSQGYGINVTSYQLNVVVSNTAMLSIHNEAGNVASYFNGTVQASGEIKARGNVYRFGSDSQYFYWDGSNFNASNHIYTPAGRLLGTNDGAFGNYMPVWGGTFTGRVQTVPGTGWITDSGGSQGPFEVQGQNGQGAKIAFHHNGSFGAYFGIDQNNQLAYGGWSCGYVSWRVIHEGTPNPSLYGNLDATGMYAGRLGIGGAKSNQFSIYWDGRAWCMIDNSNMGQFTSVSDYRAKKDVDDLKSMWDEIKKVRPVSYKFNDWTPEWEKETQEKRAKEENRDVRPFIVGDNMTQWGFIAHELQDALIPSVSSGYKDIQGAVQVPNSLPLIAMTVKVLQEAVARIELLEAKQ